jgi:lipoyl-dependent peroxiredoxin
MSISKAEARWAGSLKEGNGSMKPAHGAEIPFSVATRFEEKTGSNPEELIGAALAGCFSMALTAALERANLSARSVRTSADVKLEKGADGFKITEIALTTVANAPGVDRSKFQGIAEETKKTCPVSRALAGTNITLDATLE